jgi:hypothetical protein
MKVRPAVQLDEFLVVLLTIQKEIMVLKEWHHPLIQADISRQIVLIMMETLDIWWTKL